MGKYEVGDTVKILDGNAYIGETDKIKKVSELTPISYELEKFGRWWCHSQLERVARKCCSKQQLVNNGSYEYCKSCGVVQKGEPVYTPTGFHACPNCGEPTVTQGQYCSVLCATT